MSIAVVQRKNQAPSGAACLPTPLRRRGMPLLSELENDPVGPCFYKHAAPVGAIRGGQVYVQVNPPLPTDSRSQLSLQLGQHPIEESC